MNYECINKIILDVFQSCNIISFPFNCYDVLNNYDLNVFSYNSFNEEFKEYCLLCSDDAYSFKDKIFYNPSMPKRRIRFSLMHELGHYLLKHGENRSPEEESEANYFASNILMPRMAIHYSRIHNIKELANLFDISLECMEYSYNNYTKWIYSINRYGMSKYDKSIYLHFYNQDNKCFVFNIDHCIYCGDIIYNKNIPICTDCDKPLSNDSFFDNYEVARPHYI